MALALRSWECWVRQHECAWSQWGQSKQPRAPARGPRAARLLWGQRGDSHSGDGHHGDSLVSGLGMVLVVLGTGQDSRNPPPGLGLVVSGGCISPASQPPCNCHFHRHALDMALAQIIVVKALAASHAVISQQP